MEAIVPLVIISVFIGSLVVERLFPARPLPRVRWWLAKGVVFFVVAMAINGLVPYAIVTLLAPHAPPRLARLGLWGTPITFLVAPLVVYTFHRTFHRVPFLWRWTHQMHHSAERLDVVGGVMFHPFELMITVSIGTVVPLVVGVSPDAAALAGMIGFFYAMFQHLNVRTPRWLGVVIQRPEAHSVHHARGVHAYNYADFPVIDMLFGTWRNPAGFVEQQGFWDGASSRVGAMLIGRDIVDPANARQRPTTAATAAT